MRGVVFIRKVFTWSWAQKPAFFHKKVTKFSFYPQDTGARHPEHTLDACERRFRCQTPRTMHQALEHVLDTQKCVPNACECSPDAETTISLFFGCLLSKGVFKFGNKSSPYVIPFEASWIFILWSSQNLHKSSNVLLYQFAWFLC